MAKDLTKDGEIVTICCPHCYGTGNRWHFDRIDSKHASQCIFCDGRGSLNVKVEHHEQAA